MTWQRLPRLEDRMRMFAELDAAFGGDPARWSGVMHEGCLSDLFFLLVVGCRRLDLAHQWLLERCDEVQNEPDGCLDLWAREHYKSTIITFGLTLQEMLRNPELTIAIFSHTRPAAKGFLRQIKRELEANQALKEAFPEALWADPSKEAIGWSEDAGLVLKRKGNPKEATLEAWGIVDGQPIGKHYDLMIYDDVATADNSTTEEMRRNSLVAWELSLSLGKRGGRRRMIGTRYHYQDVYAEIIRRRAAKERRHAAEVDGKAVFLTRAELDEKRKDMGPVTYAAQMLLDPKAGTGMGFQLGWVRYYADPHRQRGNNFIIVDPASKKKKKSDYTAMWVVCLSDDQNIYVKDGLRDRLNLAERGRALIRLHREWRPLKVFYEEYAQQADIEGIQLMMDAEGYRFNIVPIGGNVAKDDRIGRLIPMFEQKRIFLPHTLPRAVLDTGKVEDMVQVFLTEEYQAWPFAGHDDMLDALSRIADKSLPWVWPMGARERRDGPPRMPVAVGTGEVVWH